MTIFRIQWITKTGKLVKTYAGNQFEAAEIAEKMNGIYGIESSLLFPSNF